VERLLSGAPAPDHFSVDLLNREAAAVAFARLPLSVDLVFAGYLERGDATATQEVNVALFANTLEALQDAGKVVRYLVLIGGGKSYGPHLGPYKTPAKESDPRILGPIFYSAQEDYLVEWAAPHGTTWTVLRPDGILGPGLGSPMNLAQGLGVYAAVCRELGLPLRFPGSLSTWSSVLHQATDSGILGRAALWATESKTAHGEIFNVTNGDLFRWKHVWKDVAEFFKMTVDEPQPLPLAVQMADKGPIWDQIVATNNLRPTP
jgi:nucleoside-diphosphate-sugar epimerase